MKLRPIIWILCSAAALLGSVVVTKVAVPFISKRPSKQMSIKALRMASDRETKRYLAILALGSLLTMLATGSWLLASLGGLFGVLLNYLTRQSESSAIHDQLLEGWPNVIDEVRIRVCTLGEAIPHALFSAAQSFGEKASSVFERSRIAWNLTGDFYLVCKQIADELADQRSTAVLQTMVLLHELASTSTESRLKRLREDRSWDLAAAKEANASMAGAIFARRFVLVVPIGMALAGAAIGGGRQSFQTPVGITLSAVALGLLLLCWIWSTHLIGLPKVRSRHFEEIGSAPTTPYAKKLLDRISSPRGR